MSRRRIGVIVLDHGRPEDAERAACSASEQRLDVRVLVVENGVASPRSAGRDRLVLPENRGFAGGMNTGIDRLASLGCDRVVLLNNDATLEAGCLLRLTEALEDAERAAVGPVILSDADGSVESRGVSVDERFGRVRLLGQGERPPERGDLVPVDALSGAVMMLRLDVFERVGRFDEDYFFSFEDVDWCLRARRSGFRLCVCLDARARHQGSLTLGRDAPARFYYAARNHVRLVERHALMAGLPAWLRPELVLGLNLGHALKQREVPRAAALRAVLEGFRDARRGRFGPRASVAATV